ncbi:MAG: hypothetical protein Q7S37_04225 [bacterium]|nr:hypothetical protein [bacterium]
MFKGLKKILRFMGGQKETKRRGAYSIDRSMVANKWSEIEMLIQAGGASRLKTAILEADKLLDYTLMAKGLQGGTMGERLKSAEKMMSRMSYQAAWDGHKLRNRLVHELDADVLHFEVKKGIENFRTVLKELQALS